MSQARTIFTPIDAATNQVVNGFTRDESAAKTDKIMNDWIVALAKKMARQDHAASLAMETQ